MDTIRALVSLRSTRQFLDRDVPDHVLADILEAARWCGSGKNGQPWRFIVIRDREMLRRLSDLGPFTAHVAGAALAIAIVMDNNTFGNMFDAGRVSEVMMLAAHTHGVGSCIAFLEPFDNERTGKRLLGVPNARRLRLVISFGYPAAERKSEMPGGAPREDVLPMLGRKPLADLVFQEHM